MGRGGERLSKWLVYWGRISAKSPPFTARNLPFGTALSFCTDHALASTSNRKSVFEIQALKPLLLMSQPPDALTCWPGSCKTDTDIS